MNARLQTFDPDGNGARELSGWGVRVGKLFRPKGVAVDEAGRVFVSDSYVESVQVFQERGTLIGVLGDGNGNVRRFTTPTNIVFDREGRLLVVETRANQISVLRILK